MNTSASATSSHLHRLGLGLDGLDATELNSDTVASSKFVDASSLPKRALAVQSYKCSDALRLTPYPPLISHDS